MHFNIKISLNFYVLHFIHLKKNNSENVHQLHQTAKRVHEGRKKKKK